MKLLPWSRLVAAQFMLTVRNRRWMELFGGAAAMQAIALAVTSFIQRMTAGQMDPSDVQQLNILVWTFGLAFVSATWPTFLWRDETPSQRRYHWSLPAARGAHDLARVAAGAIWIVILATLVIAATAVWLPLVHPDIVTFAGQFTLTLLATYGLGSIPALTTERPATWIFGVLGITAATAAIVIGAEFYAFHHGIRRIPFELVLGKAGLLSLFFEHANDRHWAGLVWLSVAVVGLAIVTVRRGGFRLAAQRAP